MQQHFPNSAETARILEILAAQDNQIDVHDRLLLNMNRNIYLSEQKQILSHMLERAHIYNTIVIATGYGSFFASWHFLAERGQEYASFYDASLIFMLVSVLVFVTWNVFTSIALGDDLFQKVKTIARNRHDPVYMFEALQKLDVDASDRALIRQKVWYAALIFTIFFASISVVLFIFIVGRDIWLGFGT